MKLNKRFFEDDTIEVAKEILGCYLVHESDEGRTVGKIVETEAYLENDPASHSFKGKTRRNEVMFGEGGKAYVYFTYGMYHCFNVVTNKKNKGEAVLIRALEPIDGIEIMKKRRKVEEIKNLCSGPGKLVISMGIKKEHNGLDLLNGKLRLKKKDNDKLDIAEAKRIGIVKGTHLPYRFYIKENEYISRK